MRYNWIRVKEECLTVRLEWSGDGGGGALAVGVNRKWYIILAILIL